MTVNEPAVALWGGADEDRWVGRISRRSRENSAKWKPPWTAALPPGLGRPAQLVKSLIMSLLFFSEYLCLFRIILSSGLCPLSFKQCECPPVCRRLSSIICHSPPWTPSSSSSIKHHPSISYSQYFRYYVTDDQVTGQTTIGIKILSFPHWRGRCVKSL